MNVSTHYILFQNIYTVIHTHANYSLFIVFTHFYLGK